MTALSSTERCNREASMSGFSFRCKSMQLAIVTLLMMVFMVFSPVMLYAEDESASEKLDDKHTETMMLRWMPPQLEDPITIDIKPGGRSAYTLKEDQDYVIQMPEEPFFDSLALNGGRNIVLVGGEINIPYQGEDATISSRRGLKIQGAIGIVHIEGLLIRGEDLSEGIQISAPDAIVQLQNIRIEDVHARDQIEFTDNHPDLIQTYGSVKELRVDYFTGSTDYQGLFFKADFSPPHGAIKLSNVNIIGRSTARYLIWFNPESGFGDVSLDNIWIHVPKERSGGFRRAIWPQFDADYPEQAQLVLYEDCICAGWPPEMEPRIIGYVQEGIPPEGDFVKEGAVGIDYVSPGYRDSRANS